MNTLSDKIKDLRSRETLTQEEFAKKIHVSREAVSRWEQGRGLPDIDNLKNISKAFNISLDSLLSNEDLSQVTISNNNILHKVKRTQMISLICIAISLIFISVLGIFSLIPFNHEPEPKTNGEMPNGILIGFYIDTKNDGNIDLKQIIENNGPSNDAYLIVKPNSNDYVHQGIHNFNDVNYRDYRNYQCEIFLSKDIIETSKYYSVYYNYRYSDYLKPHGYSLVEIVSDDTPIYFNQKHSSSNFLHQYGYDYVIYGAEQFNNYVINSSFYFTVFAVENFKKMKITEFDEEYNELRTSEVKNGDIFILKPETYQLKLYYSVDNSLWYVSNNGTFMFGGTESYNIEVRTQIINDEGYINEYPLNCFQIIQN